MLNVVAFQHMQLAIIILSSSGRNLLSENQQRIKTLKFKNNKKSEQKYFFSLDDGWMGCYSIKCVIRIIFEIFFCIRSIATCGSDFLCVKSERSAPNVSAPSTTIVRAL